MKAFLVFVSTGPMLVISKFDSIQHPQLSKRLASHGKYIAHEVPLESVKACYSAHFNHVLSDPKESDEFIVLDGDGERIFTNVSFRTLGPPVYHDPKEAVRCATPAEAGR